MFYFSHHYRTLPYSYPNVALILFLCGCLESRIKLINAFMAFFTAKESDSIVVLNGR
jgi:uncharacterized membrane protein